MKDRENIQVVVSQGTRGKKDDVEGLSNPAQEKSGDEVAKQYTYPLDPERKKRIAEAFHRRGGSGHSGGTSGW